MQLQTMSSGLTARQERAPWCAAPLHMTHWLRDSRPHSNVSCRLFSLRQQQQEFSQQLAGLLLNHSTNQSAQIEQTGQLVLQGVAAIRASRDWQELTQAFHTAAQITNQQRTSQRRGRPAELSLFNTISSSHSSYSSSRTAGISARGSAGDSRWGFAVRQPTKQKLIEQTSGKALPGAPLHRQQEVTTNQGPNSASSAGQQVISHPQQFQQWDWSSVRQLVVLGLGSISKAARPGGQHEGPNNLGRSRLHFRLFQLALATALHRHLLPSSQQQPGAWDPDFDSFDAELLTSLGFRVATSHTSLPVSCPTLLYMPCCPRDLYSQVLEANWDHHQLAQLAIFGTSMQSLVDSQALFTAWTEETTAHLREGGLVEGPADYVQRAYRQGVVTEVPCPDCAAHGVGVAIHTFSAAA
eukprot:GHRR01010269.1.p1 GENE.GHRR01010269.1~~GHRR01010269.1.p1  ORF type:complete len:411 (+),score=124.71 GHRR01010269.1:983-2215(+)